MEKNFNKPDYTRCNMNISSTLAEFLGVPNENATLPIIKKELEKNYKNVVFICFDGMGIYPMQKNLESGDFLMKNIKDTLLSTFPSTTTNATTSLTTNKLPLQHGWFGWSVNFPEMKRNINIFPRTDAWSGETVEITSSPLGIYDFYFNNAKSDYTVNSVFPSFVPVRRRERNYICETEEELFYTINDICEKPGKQFIYAYYPDPDHTMHRCGVTSEEAKAVMKSISSKVESLYKNTKDTLFIITADHGQIDVEEHIEIYKDAEIMDMLEIYPYLEPRAACFKVKEEKRDAFEKLFTERYGKDFILRKSSELIKEGYFGDTGDKGYLLGDYIAIGTYTHKELIFTPTMHTDFKGHHTSLTEEMLVPLIILCN